MVDLLVIAALKALAKAGDEALTKSRQEAEAKRYIAERLAEEQARAVVLCRECTTSIPESAVCCPACGSRAFWTAGERADVMQAEEQAQAEARAVERQRHEERKMAERARIAQRKKARERLAFLRSLRACVPCSQAFPDDHNFCTLCAARTIAFPDDQVLAYMKDEYAELVRQPSDLARL